MLFCVIHSLSANFKFRWTDIFAFYNQSLTRFAKNIFCGTKITCSYCYSATITTPRLQKLIGKRTDFRWNWEKIGTIFFQITHLDKKCIGGVLFWGFSYIMHYAQLFKNDGRVLVNKRLLGQKGDVRIENYFLVLIFSVEKLFFNTFFFKKVLEMFISIRLQNFAWKCTYPKRENKRPPPSWNEPKSSLFERRAPVAEHRAPSAEKNWASRLPRENLKKNSRGQTVLQTLSAIWLLSRL